MLTSIFIITFLVVIAILLYWIAFRIESIYNLFFVKEVNDNE